MQIGCGIASLRPIAEARQALKNVGFEILVDDDLADREFALDDIADFKAMTRSTGSTHSRVTCGKRRLSGIASQKGRRYLTASLDRRQDDQNRQKPLVQCYMGDGEASHDARGNIQRYRDHEDICRCFGRGWPTQAVYVS